MDKYLLNLYKQFCDARGVIYNPFDLNNNIDEFATWVAYNKKLVEKYREYLLSLGYIGDRSILEIGKGMYDTLYLTDSIVVSPYAETIGLPNSEFFIIGDYPLIKENGKIIKPNSEILLTHNPYEEMQILNWYSIHNSKLYDISIGMYGNVHDTNFLEKVKLLEELSKRMFEDHVFDYDIDNDNYFCSINSNRMIRTRKKLLIR